MPCDFIQRFRRIVKLFVHDQWSHLDIVRERGLDELHNFRAKIILAEQDFFWFTLGQQSL